MDVNPGDFSRLISFERVTSQGNALGGGGAKVWTEILRAYARVRQVQSKDRFQNESGIRGSSAGSFTIPYTETVIATDRILYQNKYWRITGLAEIGYRELLEISAEVPDE